MSSLTILGDTSGSVVLQAPAVAGSTTLTLPAASGTVMVSGNIPTFYAYLNSTQAVTGGVWTKVQLNAELFDTANAFNTSTNRFTPLVAGYYQINAQPGGIDTTYSGGNASAIYKNGVYYSSAYIANTGIPAISNLVYLNGSTDYVELYVYLGTSQNLTASAGSNYLSGFLARAA